MELEEMAYDGHYVAEVLHQVKSGKEATVFCCRALEETGLDLVAAKVYRPIQSRSFRNDAVYQKGRYIGDARLRRAFANKSRVGRTVQYDDWVSAEYETMRLLFDAGAAIPKPLNATSSATIMEYFGDEDTCAMPLNRVHFDMDEARRIFGEVRSNMRLFMACGRVHADLSAFNILYLNGDIRIIDFPQSVDPYVNDEAFSLLVRDSQNICDYFCKYGIEADAYKIAKRIWEEFATVNM